MFSATGDHKESEPSTFSSSVEWSQPCRHFEFSEIQVATENFDESLVIGSGGFGKVYKGNVFNGSDPVVSAIKRLDSMSKQGADEFWAEVEMLSKLRHCNLVSLIGYCNYDKEMVLVYEYMPNGTLEDHLHKLGTRLSWIQRLNICIGAGRGLHYLHTGTGIESGVVHRDVKSSNILLHETWAAKISDFGLSRMAPTNQPSTYVNTLVKGTFGYVDPNYFATGKLTRKSDVYAFGVILFEILCRKRAVDRSLDEEQWGLAAWAQESIKDGNLKDIIDSDIRGEISQKCLKMFVQIAQRCLHINPKKRPTMAEVVVTLESILNIQETNNSVQAAGKTIFVKMLHMFPSHPLEKTLVMPHPNRPNLRVYSFAELKTATRNFRSDMVLGEGHFGRVYKGWLKDNPNSEPNVIAIKKLKSGSTQGLEEWQDVDFLGSLSHANVVKLFGYCYESRELLLVYEFMQKGSLENYLFGKGSTIQPLPWDIRLKISIGAAQGLAFLHTFGKEVMFRDFKVSNILLDGDYNAKISDFGLVKIGSSASRSQITTRVMGTYGYAAHKYGSPGHLYVKSDVYGFGKVLVELLTGMRALDTNHLAAQQNLSNWVKPYLADKRELIRIMDSRLEGKYPLMTVLEISQLALACLEPSPKTRPSMSEVVEKLEQLNVINERPRVPS